MNRSSSEKQWTFHQIHNTIIVRWLDPEQLLMNNALNEQHIKEQFIKCDTSSSFQCFQTTFSWGKWLFRPSVIALLLLGDVAVSQCTIPQHHYCLTLALSCGRMDCSLCVSCRLCATGSVASSAKTSKRASSASATTTRSMLCVAASIRRWPTSCTGTKQRWW